MPITYQQNGIQLLYPENWKTVDEKPRPDLPSVTLQSPGTGYWNLTVYRDSQQPADLILETVNAMKEEYDSLETEPIECCFGDQLAHGYHMEFYCLDFIVNARAVALRVASQVLLFVYQAEDNEFRELEPVFTALAISAIGNMTDQGELPDSLSLQAQRSL